MFFLLFLLTTWLMELLTHCQKKSHLNRAFQKKLNARMFLEDLALETEKLRKKSKSVTQNV